MKGALLLVAAATCAVLILVPGQSPPTLAAPEILASPVHAGCYLAKRDQCKIHVEPFTINLAPATKLVLFRLVAIRIGSGVQTTIYDFRPDQSNPVPSSGSTFTPSLVKRDFAATCGYTYEISLQGRDTGDSGIYNLGLTGEFTCPIGSYPALMPIIENP